MKIYSNLKDPALKKRPRAIAIGIFDGVHRGHEAILKKALHAAKKMKMAGMVLTFEPHPQEILHPGKKAPKFLMSLEHRLRFFSELGISEALVIRFTKKIARITHEDFLNKLLIKKLGMKALSVGDDFRFGRFAAGDKDYLKKEARSHGFKLFLTKPLKNRGVVVSSTRIRQLIEKGDLSRAAQMLGRPVSVYGTVIHGRGRGRSVGFRTANLDPHHETLPPPGVYAARGIVGKKKLKSVVHIGERPTFKDKEKSVEVHFLDFHGDLYGKEIELFFLGWLRGVRKFSSAKQLAGQIALDIRRAKRLF